MTKFTDYADYKAHTFARTHKAYNEVDKTQPFTLTFTTFKYMNSREHSHTFKQLEKAIEDLGPEWFYLVEPDLHVVTIARNFENAEEALPHKLAAERRLKRTISTKFRLDLLQ